MFTIAEMKGFMKMVKPGIISSKIETLLMVLTNVGLIVMDSYKFEPKSFIPLHGSRVVDSGYGKEKDSRTVAISIIFKGNGKS